VRPFGISAVLGPSIHAVPDKQDDENHISSRSINNTHPTQSSSSPPPPPQLLPLLSFSLFTHLGYPIWNLWSSEVTDRTNPHNALVIVVYRRCVSVDYTLLMADEYLYAKLLQCYKGKRITRKRKTSLSQVFHYKSLVDCPGIEKRPPQ
jgi:hypothetical protein